LNRTTATATLTGFARAIRHSVDRTTRRTRRAYLDTATAPVTIIDPRRLESLVANAHAELGEAARASEDDAPRARDIVASAVALTSNMATALDEEAAAGQ
jgi:hypothetical protein